LTFLLIGVAIQVVAPLLFMSDQRQSVDEGSQGLSSTAGAYLFALVFSVPFLLAALLSVRAKVVVTSDGLHHNGLLQKRHFRWDEISALGAEATRHSVNFIPTGTSYRVVLLCSRGKHRELPAPNASRMIGRKRFLLSAEALETAVRRGRASASEAPQGRPS
jgi:hypothetical protein